MGRVGAEAKLEDKLEKAIFPKSLFEVMLENPRKSATC